MRPNKVVHLTSVHPAFDVRIFHKHCKSLAKAGYEVVLIAAHSHDVNVDRVQIRAIPKLHNRLLRMTYSVYRIFRQALREQADIYHFHDPELIPLGVLLAAQGKNVVYDVHEDLPADVRYKPYLPAWLRPRLSLLVDRFEKAASRRFAGIVCATQPISDRFVLTNQNTVVVHNFPILEELPLMPWKNRRSSVVYVGNITANRGIRELVKAVGLLSEVFDAKLVLAGSFASKHLEEEVTRLRGWSRVEYCGFVDRQRIAEILSSARVGAIILYPEPNFVRSMPIKLFEYMACGIPVVASNFPAWHEIIQNAGCGLLVDPVDPNGIARAIEYLLGHPDEAEAMGRRGREAIERSYNWRSEEEKLFQFYEHLLQSRAVAGPMAAPRQSSAEVSR